MCQALEPSWRGLQELTPASGSKHLHQPTFSGESYGTETSPLERLDGARGRRASWGTLQWLLGRQHDQVNTLLFAVRAPTPPLLSSNPRALSSTDLYPEKPQGAQKNP